VDGLPTQVGGTQLPVHPVFPELRPGWLDAPARPPSPGGVGVPLSELRSGSSPALGDSTPLVPLLAWSGGAVQEEALAASIAGLMFRLSSAMMRVSAVSPPADALAPLGAGVGLGHPPRAAQPRPARRPAQPVAGARKPARSVTLTPRTLTPTVHGAVHLEAEVPMPIDRRRPLVLPVLSRTSLSDSEPTSRLTA